jgi:hypothetical protein
MTRLTDEERDAAETIANTDLSMAPFAKALLHIDEGSSYSNDAMKSSESSD